MTNQAEDPNNKLSAKDKQWEKQGFLYKYGENIVTDAWRKRWFVLKNEKLMYYKSQHDSHAVGIIPLTDSMLSNLDQNELTFQIETPYRTYLLKATTSIDFIGWTEQLQKFSTTKRSRHSQFVMKTKPFIKTSSVLTLRQSITSNDMLAIREIKRSLTNASKNKIKNTMATPQDIIQDKLNTTLSGLSWVKTKVSSTIKPTNSFLGFSTI